MPWYSPWSYHITKRVCKYLLQRYLGNFLEEKLTLDQLNVDLYKGLGIISNVCLDVQALNEVAEQQNIPFEFIDGFIGEMSVSIPWSSILNDATYIEVKGMSLTVRQKQRKKTTASMFESMWSSMSSSMQLAEDCLKNEKKEGFGQEDMSNFEGIEHFAQTIDSILRRIKVKLLNTTISLEETLYNGISNVSFELDIKLIEYTDEAGLELEQEKKQGFQLPVFSTKKIFLEGVTINSYECSVIQAVNSSCGNENLHESNTNEEYSEGIILGRLSGRQEITIKFKQEEISGPKIELQMNLGALTIFISPHQAHNLLNIINGVTVIKQRNIREARNHCPERKMEDSDYRKIEYELQMNMNPTNTLQPRGLTDQGWANMSLDTSDDEFGPLNTSKLDNSIISSATSLSGSTSSLGTNKSSYIQTKASTFVTKKLVHSGHADLDSNSVIFQFHILLSSVTIILLHDDILTASSDSSEPLITKSSSGEMRRVAKDFFDKLGHFAIVGYGHKDFVEAQELFSQACRTNHLRFMAAPVVLEGSEIYAVNSSVIKGNCIAASLNIRECLYEKETPSQKRNVEYVELLKFTNYCGNNKKEIIDAFESEPNFKLSFKLTNMSKEEKSKKYSLPKSEFSFILQPCEVEVDVTIIDRISTLLNMESFFGTKCGSNNRKDNAEFKGNIQSHFQQAVDNSPHSSSKIELKISSSFVVFKVRFPIPDFRPIHDLDKLPWWKRSVRSDILYLDTTDFTFNTIIKSQETVLKFESQFRDAVVKFKEGECEKAVPFVRASVDRNCDPVSEYDQGIEWPRLVIYIHPKSNKSSLDENESFIGYFKSHSHSAGQQSLITTLENTSKKEHSPFSCKRVVHESDTPHSKTSVPEQAEGEELVIPGDRAEIADFIEIASVNTRIKLDLYLPTASLVFPSKHMFEVIYNRISSDLFLWEPSAPAHSDYVKFNVNCWPVNELINTFHVCKSGIQSETDSDSDSQEESFYSVYEQKLRHKKKQILENNSLVGQSKVALHINISQGLCDVYTPARDSQGNVIPGQHGQLHVSFEEGSLFLVSGYKGKSDLDYLCVQLHSFSVFHNGLISDALQKYTYVGSKVPSYLQQLVYKTDKCASLDQNTIHGNRFTSSYDMLTVSVQVERKGSSNSFKMFRVAAGIRNAILRHIVCQGQTSWFTQLTDFFDVDDYPIAGYEPCSVLTEINVHLWNCCVDYRPLYLPIRSVLTVGNFNISSNMATQTNSSTLRFIAEEAALFISEKCGNKIKYSPPDLRKDYVCVGEIGLFELSLRLSDKNQPHPKVDLRASGSVAHVWTCADSAKALAELLMYFASDGDFSVIDEEKELNPDESKAEKNENENVLIKTEDNEYSHVLSKSQVSLVIDLMEEAMKESKVESVEKKAVECTTKFAHSEKEKQKCTIKKCITLGSELIRDSCDPLLEDLDKEDNWEKEFCILEHEAGIGILPKKGLPEVRNLTGAPVRLVDNHFSIPLGKADLLRSPKHYPKPVLRYLLRGISVVWHMYGGSDFRDMQEKQHKQIKIGQNLGLRNENSVSYSKNAVHGLKFESLTTNTDNCIHWKERGGPKRRQDILMELQLNKIRFQHEVYPENTNEASRQVLLIQDVELRDRLATSPINKFLYQYTSEAKPKQSQAPMVIIKSVLMRSDPKLNAQECCLKVSLLPLRLNIDQDSVLFLYSFFNEISGDYKEEEEETLSKMQTTIQHIPIMSVNVQGKSDETKPESYNLLIELDEEKHMKTKNRRESKRNGFTVNNKKPSPPLFFRCFIFSPDVPVRLDYQGKRVDMSHGPLAGILMGLGQLNNSELKLRKVSYKHGLLGFDKLISFVLSEWTNDIKKNQLPSLLGGVGPMHSLVQLIQGIRDLFWLPIEQYQRDGRFVRGIQRGANSFTTSTAMACLELTSRVIQLIQSTAETAYDMVSPGPSVRTKRRGNGKRRRHTQPADIREGVTNAYLVVKEGIGETAETIVRIASEEHEQKGMTGAVGGVLRQIPPTVVKPIILATEATNNVIGGMRSQLVPDARREAVEKWRKQDV